MGRKYPRKHTSSHNNYLFIIYLFIQHLLARPKTANKHERSGDSQPRQAKKGKKRKMLSERERR